MQNLKEYARFSRATKFSSQTLQAKSDNKKGEVTKIGNHRLRKVGRCSHRRLFWCQSFLLSITSIWACHFLKCVYRKCGFKRSVQKGSISWLNFSKKMWLPASLLPIYTWRRFFSKNILCTIPYRCVFQPCGWPSNMCLFTQNSSMS